MNNYQSHKKVQALKIRAAERGESGFWVLAFGRDHDVITLNAENNERFKITERDLGYYVVYEDGYVSWSPTHAFESGYTLITPSGNPPPSEPNALKVWAIARVAYHVNNALRLHNGEKSALAWTDAPPERVASLLSGVRYKLTHPDVTPEEQHQEWCRTKILQGWIWGLEENEALKTHPNLIEYADLTPEQQLKDKLFHAVVKAMA